MAGSYQQGKDEIKEFIKSCDDIKSIVDVGPGCGTYAKLLGRKYDFYGVEVFEDYIERFKLDSLYKDILIADVKDVIWWSVGYPRDCIIFGDVIEHLKKKNGIRVLRDAIKWFRHVIISVPLSSKHREIREGRVHYGNEHERHVSAWIRSDIEKLANWDLVVVAGKNNVGIFAK